MWYILLWLCSCCFVVAATAVLLLCCCCAAAAVLLLLLLLLYTVVFKLIICALYRFIWSVDVSCPNTTRRQVGLASFSTVQHMSLYSRSQYEKGEDIAIYPTIVYV